MRQSHAKTVLSGISGGVAMNLAMLLIFRFTGFGAQGKGFLLNPEIQRS